MPVLSRVLKLPLLRYGLSWATRRVKMRSHNLANDNLEAQVQAYVPLMPIP
jgi:hypothetical protein